MMNAIMGESSLLHIVMVINLTVVYADVMEWLLAAIPVFYQLGTMILQ